MLSTSRWAAIVAVALLSAGCRSSIEVRTMAAPDAGLTNLHSFRVLPAAPRRDGRAVSGTDDPMIANSIANRALREHVVKAFLARGYTLDERSPDFVVAFYATARDKLDVNAWDYGYVFDARWPQGRPVAGVSQYTEGSVVIDVLKPGPRTLLWRGDGRAQLADDPSENVKQLVKMAEAIVDRFPKASERVVAVAP